MMVAAVKSARTLYIFRPNEEKNSGKGLIRAEIFLTSLGKGLGQD